MRVTLRGVACARAVPLRLHRACSSNRCPLRPTNNGSLFFVSASRNLHLRVCPLTTVSRPYFSTPVLTQTHPQVQCATDAWAACLREAVGDPNSLGGRCRWAPTVGALRDACRSCAFLTCLLLRRLTGSPPSVASSRGPAWACACLTCLEAGACSSCISPAFDCSIAMMPVPSRVLTSGTGAALDCTASIAGVAITRWECKRCSPARVFPLRPQRGDAAHRLLLVLYHRRRALRLNYAITHILYNSGKIFPELYKILQDFAQ